jgi:hypothetical protein
MKNITHVFAFIGASVWAFLATPAGQAVLHQYPILSALAGAVSTVFVVYHNPLKSN